MVDSLLTSNGILAIVLDESYTTFDVVSTGFVRLIHDCAACSVDGTSINITFIRVCERSDNGLSTWKRHKHHVYHVYGVM